MSRTGEGTVRRRKDEWENQKGRPRSAGKTQKGKIFLFGKGAFWRGNWGKKRNSGENPIFWSSERTARGKRFNVQTVPWKCLGAKKEKAPGGSSAIKKLQTGGSEEGELNFSGVKAPVEKPKVAFGGMKRREEL